MGMNMICILVDKALQYILSNISYQSYYLRSNHSSDKKASFNSIEVGRSDIGPNPLIKVLVKNWGMEYQRTDYTMNY